MTEQRSCQNCHKDFTIEPEDFAFYGKMQVPPPTFCHHCRLQRRFAWRNERGFYHRPCDLCSKKVIAMYPEKTPFPVYCRECWYSDKWDAVEYGTEYDFSRPFFKQYQELQQKVPRIALQQSNCINSEYANQVADCKNCYLISSGAGNEDCYFSYRVEESNNVFDSYALVRCQYAYEVAMARDSANIYFGAGIADSHNLWFCDEPRGCQECFMSSNLRQKSYVFRGEQLSKEEYRQKISEVDFGSYKTIEALRQEFLNMQRNALRAPGTFKNVVNTTGNGVANAKDCHFCFHGTDLENCRYVVFLTNAKDCMDVNNGSRTLERYYEVSTGGMNSRNIKFSVDAWPEVRDLEYCDSCRSGASDLFGCISLRGKQYCILNKQYSKEEYEQLIPKIKEQMNALPYTDAKGNVYKYGEFFPIELSPFSYSDTTAISFFPLTEAQAKENNYPWQPSQERHYAITMPATDLPDNIKDVSDDILKEVIGCAHGGSCGEQCTTAFRLVPGELQFYRQSGLPLPRLCPNCRHYRRLKERTPLNLWQRQCACGRKDEYQNQSQHFHGSGPCPNEFKTNYSPDRPETVYCEQCYQAEVV